MKFIFQKIKMIFNNSHLLLLSNASKNRLKMILYQRYFNVSLHRQNIFKH